MRPADRSGFQVAIICALPGESRAMRAAFDEFWEDDRVHYGKELGDTNSYTLGRIGRHSVVLAYMPSMGKVSSAIVAANLRASFPNIPLGLVVGICGAVPRPESEREEISFGDVFVSTSAVQFDFGRQLEDRVIRKDTVNDNLGRPSLEIRSFLHIIRTKRNDLRQCMSKYITEICAKEGFSDLACPPLEEDAPMVGMSRTSDSAANFAPVSIPNIHSGPIASGDVVMKSEFHRDRIAKEENVLGFKMEGASVWDIFPTIIVKGVCDYADSHKNKKWQPYASGTAAACAKALLCEWRSIDSVNQPEAKPGEKISEGVVFNNNAKVANQGVNQIFHGSVTFN